MHKTKTLLLTGILSFFPPPRLPRPCRLKYTNQSAREL